MPKFQTVMDAVKFKNAINHLPNPGEGVEFTGFRATREGDKNNVYIGLYVGPAMSVDFNQDKGRYKSPTLIKGTIQRSAKQPTKKLVFESSGQKSLIKELGKESLKANKLKYVIVAIERGEPEPDVTPAELAEMGLAGEATNATAAQPTTAAPVQKPATTDGNQKPAAIKSPPRPTTDAPDKPFQTALPEGTRSPEARALMKRLTEFNAKIKEIQPFDRATAASLTTDLKTVAGMMGGPDVSKTHETVNALLNVLDGPPLWKAHAGARVGKRRAGLHQAMTNRFQIVEKTAFVKGEAARVDAKLNQGNEDPAFRALIHQLGVCEVRKDAQTLSQFETRGRAYLKAIQEKNGTATPADKERTKFIQTQLTHARLAQMALKYQALGDAATWDGTKEAEAGELQAAYFFEEGTLQAREGDYGADPLGGDGGVNGSWWIRRVDPADREGKGSRKFIFKPTDAEDASIGGVKAGSLAAREALAKVFNDELFAAAGFDAGVCPTVLANIDSGKLPGPDGKCAAEPTRLGSMQQLVDPVLGDAKFFAKKGDREPFKTIGKDNLEQIGIFDLMTGAMDRHFGNVMLAKGAEDSTKVVPIDHGLTMPNRETLLLHRRRIATNVLVHDAMDPNGHTKQPLSPAVKKGILQVKPAEMIQTIKDARQAMAQAHGEMQDDMTDENFAVMQRSIEFLQQACTKDFSLADLVGIMSKYAPEIQSAAPDQLESLVNRIAREVQDAKQAKAELKELYPTGKDADVLSQLGWWLEPGGESTRVWIDENPAEAARIIKGRIVNPVVQAENDAMIQQLGGPDKAKELKISLTQPPGDLYTALKRQVEKAPAKPDPTAGMSPEKLQAEFARLGGPKAWDDLVGKYHGLNLETDPARLLVQQIRNLQNEEQVSVLEAQLTQVEADPAWRDYERWVGKKPAVPAEVPHPRQMRQELDSIIKELADWKEFEKEGGITEYNRLGGNLGADGQSLRFMLRQLRWAKSQEQALKTACATDDKVIVQTQVQAIQQALTEAQGHYSKLPRPAAVQAFTRRAQDITAQLGNPAGLSKLEVAAGNLRDEAARSLPIYTQWEKKLGLLRQVVNRFVSKKHARAGEMSAALDEANRALDDGRAEAGRTACENLEKLAKELTEAKK